MSEIENSYFELISIGDHIIELPKSKIPASAAIDNGKYPFICSSSELRYTDSYIQNVPAVVMGTGGVASVHFGEGQFAYSTDTWAIRSKSSQLDTEFLYRKIQQLLPDIDFKAFEGSGLKHLRKNDVKRLEIEVPSDSNVSKKILYILNTIDQTIEKTEALIAKYQLIKAGLMQDLFTRGIGADGKLRPPCEQAPELYKETDIGWIPKDWEVVSLDSVKESLSDGPFGSNLKTEHYVTDLGVRVVRLQNISASNYNDEDKAFISEKHANFLIRQKVIGNDILIAGLGDERYPVGRACLYPLGLPPAVNKADCFRLRCNDQAMNGFIMYYLNTSLARRQISKYEQGVTRPRINTGNLKKILIIRPIIKEQEIIFEQLSKIESKIDFEIQNKQKLQFNKQGLMHDLLTGKVAVTVDDGEDHNV